MSELETNLARAIEAHGDALTKAAQDLPPAKLGDLLPGDPWRDEWRSIMPNDQQSPSASPAQDPLVAKSPAPARSSWTQREIYGFSAAAVILIAMAGVFAMNAFRQPKLGEILLASSSLTLTPPRGVGEAEIEVQIQSPRDGWASIIAIVDGKIEVYPRLNQGDGVRVFAERASTYGPLDLPVGAQGLVAVTPTSSTHFLRTALQETSAGDLSGLRRIVEETLRNGGHPWIAVDEWRVDSKTQK